MLDLEVMAYVNTPGWPASGQPKKIQHNKDFYSSEIQ